MNDRDAPAIFACPNGPLLVRGGIELFDETGEPIVAHRRTVALCRCGASAIRPFCDGSHKLNGFRTVRPEREPAVAYDEVAPADRG